MKELLVKLAPAGGFLLLAVLLFVFRWMSDPFWWFSVAALLAAGLVIWEVLGPQLSALWNREYSPRILRGRTIRLGPAAVDLVVFLGLLGLTIAILPEIAQGHRLVNHDHPVHYFKAWQLKENFLEQGRLYGWSHLWYAGYPAQMLYPIGVDLLIIGIWAAGLGFITMSKAYAWAFLLFWFLQGWSLYMVGRATVGRWAGLFAAIFVLSDTASFRFGGWEYAGEWGVWPNSLSIALGMMAVAYLPRVLHDHKSWRPVALFGFWMGCGLITHPMQIMHLAILVPVAALVLIASEAKGSRAVGLIRLGAASGIGALIGALWVLPFLGAKDASENYGVAWRTSFDMGSRLFHANLLEGSWVVPSVLAVFGVLALAFNRQFKHAFLGVMAVVLLGTASTTFLSAFNLVDLSDSFTFVQYQRFSILLKPYAFLAAGFAIVAIFRTAKSPRWQGARGGLLIRFLVVGVLASPIIFGVFDTYRNKGFERRVTLEKNRPYRVERPKAADWLNEQWAKKKPNEFWRTALHVGGHDHGFTDIGARLKMPVYKIGYTPAETFTYKMEARNPTVLKAVNVRYILASKSLPGSQFELIETFGGLKIYEFKEWTPDPFVVREGKADVTLKSWSDERIVFDLNVEEPGVFQLNVSDFSRWHATLAGEELEITAEPIATEEERSGMMTVPMKKSGELVFEYRSGAREKLAILFFLLGMLLVIFLLIHPALLKRLEPLGTKVASLETRFERPVQLAAAAVISGAVVVALILAAWVPGSKEEDDAERQFDFTSKIHTANVSQKVGARLRHCPWVLGHHVCDEEDYKHVQATFVDIEKSWRRCIWAHPENGRVTQISFNNTPGGTHLRGWYGIANSGKGGKAKVDFKIALDGVVQLDEKTKKDDQLHPFELELEKNFSGDVQFQISAPDQGKRHFCFFAETVEYPEK